MPERDPMTPPERSSMTGPWKAPVSPPILGSSLLIVPPTVRSDSGSQESSGAVRKVDLESPLPLPRPGVRLDSFLLEETIGMGGMGAVFRAHDGQLDRTVALKILPPDQARDPEAVQRFYQEGRAAASLDHETIARVYSIGHAENCHYIAFEFIEGCTIRQRVERDGIISIGDAINFTLQMATALVHAAERGVVHRDVKPSNIIITPQGRAKLVDMGLARRFERGGDAGLTQTGMTLGTFDYISPEQARDPRSVDVRSDLYSLGCTLFYMLAGRPPFPDGTVLQKLLQHQEEPPPDVRAMNPAVPADLAAILLKLMAKDRDRRYQTPELLVRDLLLVAGSLNLRSLSPEGLVWMDATPPPAWERHLVWGIPSLAFAVILVFLIWNGQQGETSPSISFPPEIIGPVQKVGKPSTLPSQASSPALKLEPTPAVKPEPSARAAGRDVIVRKNDDLGRLLAESPAGTTLLLADDGPYDLRPGPDPLTPRDLTIRAGIGLKPVVRLASEFPSSKTVPALLDLKGGRLSIDGVEFHIDSDDRDAPLAAIRSQDTALSLAHCVFRQVGTKPGKGQTTGLHLRETSGTSDWKGPAEVVVDASHFEGGQHAILAEGPVDITLRDTTIGATRLATIVGLNKIATNPMAVIHLNHVSLIAGEAPVFRCVGVSPRVQMNDCVIAPSGDGVATLVSADDPSRLVWRGRDNLYARIAIFLQADRESTKPFNAIRAFDTWADDPSSVREAGSSLVTARVWSDPNPSLALTNRPANPSLAFRLRKVGNQGGPQGARRGPSGAINSRNELAMNGAVVGEASSVNPLTVKSPTDEDVAAFPDPTEPKARPLVVPPVPVPMPMPMPTMRDPNEDPPGEMPPPMEIDTGEARPAATAPTANESPSKAPSPTKPDGPAKAIEPSEPVPSSLDGKLIRTASQLTAALGQVGGRGQTLRLAADAEIEMSTCQLRGTGSWVIQGEPGKTRPRIIFRPGIDAAKVSDIWTVWLNILSGSLRLERVDLVLPKGNAPRSGGWGAFALSAGTDLSLSDCTVTIEGSVVRSAVIVAPVGREANGFGDVEIEPLTATVRLRDSLFRAGGDLVDVASDRRLDLEVDNALVATGGSLLHGHGRAKGIAAEPLKFTLRRLTARAEGGLIQLGSTALDSELPQVEVVARDSVLTTNGKGTPLIQVDGQDDPEGLRDRVRWDGSGVAYHQITNYRRDQVAKPGELPTSFDRPSWELAVGRLESGSNHGVAMFTEDWPIDRPAWMATPANLRIKPESAAGKSGSGTDLRLIPEPPSPS